MSIFRFSEEEELPHCTGCRYVRTMPRRRKDSKLKRREKNKELKRQARRKANDDSDLLTGNDRKRAENGLNFPKKAENGLNFPKQS